ncbi:P-loop containing nucleoside triphosphate hydrolase protein [Dipodascopsis uninucleata]
MSDSEDDYDITNAIASLREDIAVTSESELEDDDFKNILHSGPEVKRPNKVQDIRLISKAVPQYTNKEDESYLSSDDDFFRNLSIPTTKVGQSGKIKRTNPGKFQSFGLSQNLLKNIQKKGFNTPTPIQRKTLPLVLDGLDVVGMARTGSGKTAAFVLPMIEKLKTHSAKVGARAIILSPSRELALQTIKVVKDFSKGTDLRSVLLVGGDSLDDQFGWMMSNPDIIIATPGRLLHLKVEMDLDLRSVEYIVFDEADRLFELGFSTQLTSLLASLPASRQTLLFSATLPKSLVEFARAGLHDPVLVRLDAESKISSELESFFFGIKSAELDGALAHMLREIIKMPTKDQMPKRVKPVTAHNDYYREDGEEEEYEEKERQTSGNDSDIEIEASKGKYIKLNSNKDSMKFKKIVTEGKKKDKKGNLSVRVPKGNEITSPYATIIFTPTRHHVEYVAGLLRSFNYAVSYIYGSLDQHARREQLAEFRGGYTSILVVTDVAARGIDIPILSNVINYSFPASPKVFVHRVGRTARAGKRGRAYSLIKESDLPYLLDLELFLGKKLILPSEVPEDQTRDDLSFTENMYLGSFPRDDIERSCEDVQNILNKDYDLSALLQVAKKGEKLYLKTRGSASMESVKRSKGLSAKGWDDLNPIFREHRFVERETMLQRLANFRPSETIFEVTHKGGIAIHSSASLMKRRRQQVAPIKQHAIEKGTVKRLDINEPQVIKSSRDDESRDDERSDRAFNGFDGDIECSNINDADLISATEDEISSTFKAISEKNSKRKRDNSEAVNRENLPKKSKRTSFKDESHYISHYAPSEMAQDRGYGVNTSSVISFMDAAPSATFDLVADERQQGSGVIGSNRTKFTHWDKKKGKYITRNSLDEDATKGGKKGKMIRGENGVRLPASYKSGRFEAWKQANKKKARNIEEPTAALSDVKGGLIGPGLKERKFRHKSIAAPKPADKLRNDFRSRQKRFNEAKEKGLVKDKKAPMSGELRSTDQIRKMRQLQEKRREKNARPSRKGRK